VEIVIRIVLIYGLLTLSFRALGKREMSQLSPFELVMLLMVAEVVSPALTAGDHSFTGAIIGAATLFCLVFAHSLLSYTSAHFRRATEAPPSVLVRNGQIIEQTIHLNRVRPDEIFSEMHKAGIEDLSQVKWALLEPDGKMSFIRVDGAETTQDTKEAPV
jgi:uncharacterized membrane protein YcaP (DUF421 family)